MDEELATSVKHGIIPDAVITSVEAAVDELHKHLEGLKNDVEVEGASMRVSLLANSLLIIFQTVVGKNNGMTGTEVSIAMEAFIEQVNVLAHPSEMRH